MRDHYQGRAATRYDRVWRAFTTRMLTPVVALAVPHLAAGKRMLDAGCGTGVLLDLLRAQQPDLVAMGADSSAAVLTQAHSRLGDRVPLLPWDLDQPPPAAIMAAAPFDLITCTNVAHYLTAPAATLRALTALLAPSGMLILSDFVRHGWWWSLFEPVLLLADRQHRHTLSPGELTQLMTQAGLAVTAQQEVAAGGPWRGCVVVGEKPRTSIVR